MNDFRAQGPVQNEFKKQEGYLSSGNPGPRSSCLSETISGGQA